MGADPTVGGPARRALLGRERELGRLDELMDAVGSRGGSLVVRGEAGIGKSALLEAAVDRARGHGATVVTATGTQAETRFAFGALHRLLLPFLDGRKRLPDPQRRALDIVFGVPRATRPNT